MSLPHDFEPAVRDPKKLRLTAWILVAIMVLGGTLILLSYEKWAIKQSADDRPSMVHRIRKERDLRVIRQDGKTADLFELRGKVWAVHVTSLAKPETSARSMAVMKRLAEKHAATPDFHLVTLALDPAPADQIVGLLGKGAADHGISLPQWWLGTNEAATLHKFIKSELKSNIFPHQENGTWVYDTSIVLIDKEGHVRRAVVPQKRGGQPFVATFDFDQAAQWDKDGIKTGTDRSNEGELEKLLETTIDTLLKEPAETPSNS